MSKKIETPGPERRTKYSVENRALRQYYDGDVSDCQKRGNRNAFFGKGITTDVQKDFLNSRDRSFIHNAGSNAAVHMCMQII